MLAVYRAARLAFKAIASGCAYRATMAAAKTAGQGPSMLREASIPSSARTPNASIRLDMTDCWCSPTRKRRTQQTVECANEVLIRTDIQHDQPIATVEVRRADP